EIQFHIAQAEFADRPDILQTGNSVERSFNRDRYLLLHFLGGPCWILSNHLDQRRRGIGIRLDIEAPESPYANRQPGEDQHNHDRSEGQEGGNYGLHYCCSPSSWLRTSAAPSVTTVSPALSPEVISRLPLNWVPRVTFRSS